MNRLTRNSLITDLPMPIKLQESCGEDACMEACEQYVDNNCNEYPIQECMSKLAAYENTELEPEQIDELNKMLLNDQIRHGRALDKLLEYQKLEKQGLLIKLPCKVGDTVFIYADFTKNFEPYTVEAIHLGSCYTMQFDCNLYMLDELIDATEFELEDIGKTVFLTEKEIKKALEASNGE